MTLPIKKAGRKMRPIAQPMLRFSRQHPVWASALLCAMLLLIAWAAVWLITPLAPFGNYTLCTNDGYAQYMPFLSMFRRTITENGSFLYNFDGALGSNFYLTVAYYLFSPFSFLVLLFDASQIPAAANLIIILKNVMVGAIMAGFLASRKTTRSALLCASCGICYALGFYFLGYAVNFMWMDSIALLPLMIYGMERLLTRRGRLIYLLSLAWGILCNFYMGAIICLFLALYYFVMRFRFSKEGMKEFFWFAFCSIDAALLAGIVLMPVVFGMLGANSQRMSAPDFEIYNNYQYILSRFLPDAEVVRITHNRGTLNVYSGSISFFLILLYILQKPKSRRTHYGLLGLWTLYLISTQVSWLNFAFHGFYLQRQVPNRFGFLIGFLGALMAFDALCRLKKTKRWKITLSALAACAFFIIASIAAGSEHIWVGIVLALVIAIAWLAAWKRLPGCTALLLAAESLGGICMCAPGTLSEAYTDMGMYLQAAKQADRKRAEILATNIVNSPSLYGLKGMSAFNSVINPDTASFLGKLGFATGENYYRYYGHTPATAMMLGMQTVIMPAGAQLPYPYQHVSNEESLSIWHASFDISMGLTNLDPNAALVSKNEFENINALFPDLFEVVPIKADIDAKSEVSEESDGVWKIKEIKEKDLTTLRLQPTEENDFYIFANMGGCGTFKVSKNGQQIENNSYEGNMVYLGNLTSEDKVEIIFEADNDKDEATARIYGASLDPSKTARLIGELLDGGLQNQTVSKNRISGTRNSEHAETMVFTVPYDVGWSAKVDGQEVPVEIFHEAFPMIRLEPGEHQIEMTFMPPGLRAGAAMSLLGVPGAMLVFALPDSKKKQKSKETAAGR